MQTPTLQIPKPRSKNALYDPYIKAIRWASDRIGQEGIVAFVTNNGFLDGLAFDGMRKHLADDFDAIYILDLGGNARKGLKVSNANVFGIRVGVSINLFVKNRKKSSEKSDIFYYRTDDLWNKERKFNFLNEHQHAGNVEWNSIEPNKQHIWLTEGLHAEFDTFISMGTKEAKASKGTVTNVIFKTYSNGVKTNRDAWICNFNRNLLSEKVRLMIDAYNQQAFNWERKSTSQHVNIDDFVEYDDFKIKWSSTLKRHFASGHIAEFSESKLRQIVYRPFTKTELFFDKILIDRPALFPTIFPIPETETENRVIYLTDKGSEKPFMVLMGDRLADLHVVGPGCSSQAFPFYTYNEDGTNRQENVTRLGIGGVPNPLRG